MSRDDYPTLQQSWNVFIEGRVYAHAEAPWRDDPAYGLLQEFPGLAGECHRVLEEHLAQHGRLLLQTPQVTVLQRST